MKLVIFSDAHGNKDVVESIMEFNPDADYLISLGDSELDQDFLLSNDIIPIKGNSPRDAGFVYERILEVEGKRIFLTHGHKFAVHRNLRKLGKYAIENQCNIVLYGHTHILEKTMMSGIVLINPGSCSRPRNTLPPTYLIIEITEEETKYTFKDSFANNTIEV